MDFAQAVIPALTANATLLQSRFQLSLHTTLFAKIDAGTVICTCGNAQTRWLQLVCLNVVPEPAATADKRFRREVGVKTDVLHNAVDRNFLTRRRYFEIYKQ
ncbi:unnamed protein product [Enterobius vermicularis]|uniref:Uncharacterized protein n=1 Tax=Enterobius vermicularis TaxID=51028 RepID=A0A0N4UTB4_ENTVE|nr:unnamed protein product [Enterobius vermicularis]